jgi:hypothetical protein
MQLAFQDLTGAVGNPTWIKEWEQLEACAVNERGEAMMIYNVSPIKGIFTLFASWLLNILIVFGFCSYFSSR